MTRLPFFVQMGAFDPSMSATPQAFAAAMVERMRIVGPSGYYGIVWQETEPTSNQGLWLKPGENGSRQAWVFDPGISRYVPLDVSASITSVLDAIAALQAKFARGRVIFSQFDSPPGEVDRANVLWIPTINSVAQGVYAWNGTKWSRVAGAGASTISTSGTATAFTGDAGDPEVLAESDLFGRLFTFITHTTNGEAATFQYSTFTPRPLTRPDGTALLAGELPGGTVFVARLDGTGKWRVLTPLTPLVTPALTKRFVSAELDFSNQSVPHNLGAKPQLVELIAVCTSDTDGYIKGDEFNADILMVVDNSDQDTYRYLHESRDSLSITIAAMAESGETPFYLAKVPTAGDGGARRTFEASKWKLKIVAFA